MYVSSRPAAGQVIAIALLLIFGGFGSPVLRAQGHGCPQETKECPPPALREKPTVQPAETCCPVDPKEVKKAQKAAEHAQHEAAEACKRQQRAAAKAQRRVDEAQAKGNHKIEQANAKLERRNADHAEAQAKLDSLSGPSGPSEATAQAESVAPPEAQAQAQAQT